MYREPLISALPALALPASPADGRERDRCNSNSNSNSNGNINGLPHAWLRLFALLDLRVSSFAQGPCQSSPCRSNFNGRSPKGILL